ncbi:hypothetical protein [Methanosphaerula subterraneus]|uniref:hypothetical protein n=1 Tax=Methanosphaerula subterraneus TaxID=3350244 RepID=UPI003F8249E7
MKAGTGSTDNPILYAGHLIDAGLFGRCSVCGLQVAAYNHAGSGTALCSVCFEKLVREQVEIR